MRPNAVLAVIAGATTGLCFSTAGLLLGGQTGETAGLLISVPFALFFGIWLSSRR